MLDEFRFGYRLETNLFWENWKFMNLSLKFDLEFYFPPFFAYQEHASNMYSSVA